MSINLFMKLTGEFPLQSTLYCVFLWLVSGEKSSSSPYLKTNKKNPHDEIDTKRNLFLISNCFPLGSIMFTNESFSFIYAWPLMNYNCCYWSTPPCTQGLLSQFCTVINYFLMAHYLLFVTFSSPGVYTSPHISKQFKNYY